MSVLSLIGLLVGIGLFGFVCFMRGYGLGAEREREWWQGRSSVEDQLRDAAISKRWPA